MSRMEEIPRRGPQVREQLNSLKHFQQHSRLHFIGQWKTKASDLFKEWFKEKPFWNHGDMNHQVLFAHLDMDAFFCSVALAKEENYHLRDKPVCIAAGKYNSDISSCNYIARSYGVRAGMYVNAAKEICPSLQVLGYDLPRCEEVNKCLYRILFEFCPDLVSMAVEVYSIDEVMIAFDTDDYNTIIRYCKNVREEVKKSTNCTVSCGIGPNIMLARIATTFAKPNGIHFIRPEDTSSIVAQLPFNKIHGVGDSAMAKLRPLMKPYFNDSEITDESILCRHVQKLTKQQMQRSFGQKTGVNFFNLCRGNDTRVVSRTGDDENQKMFGKKSPSSVSCSMNYAVRPTSLDDIWSIARQLLEVVCNKLEKGDYSSSGLRVTMLERHPLHPKETQKFMGRGRCVEYHIPVCFESTLVSSDLETMLQRVKDTLTPLLVCCRPITDEERARELGLDDDAWSKTVWTVTINADTNVVVSDVRGMTIQATGLHVEQGTKGVFKRARSGQLSLADAFSKGSDGKEDEEKEKQQQQLPDVLNVSASMPGVVESTFDLCILDRMMDRDIDSVFVQEWKDVARRVGRQADYTAIKSLLRVAAFRFAMGSMPVDEAREEFKSLVAFANALLPVPVSFV
ncbi:putative DNA damage repair protein [Trypanosoma grayi]|uniref:putative DNA damage repair protein n=1 Tax=Trypanosoma grayi TaxID=71804 RepID=UPI0004F465C9|nr:putative DNA damage repair protein [Trypanosoma grayi]KEG13447.1 putative DNA damage repair protein [Trypanosoma grayi]